MPPKEFDFNSVSSKTFVDSVNIRVINGLLYLALQSGKDSPCFLMPLPLAKLVGRGITKQVEEIELKNNVKFDDRLPDEPMLSPLTRKDGPKGPGDAK